jgi:hypothetical protein
MPVLKPGKHHDLSFVYLPHPPHLEIITTYTVATKYPLHKEDNIKMDLLYVGCEDGY